MKKALPNTAFVNMCMCGYKLLYQKAYYFILKNL